MLTELSSAPHCRKGCHYTLVTPIIGMVWDCSVLWLCLPIISPELVTGSVCQVPGLPQSLTACLSTFFSHRGGESGSKLVAASPPTLYPSSFGGWSEESIGGLKDTLWWAVHCINIAYSVIKCSPTEKFLFHSGTFLWCFCYFCINTGANTSVCLNCIALWRHLENYKCNICPWPLLAV